MSNGGMLDPMYPVPRPPSLWYRAETWWEGLPTETKLTWGIAKTAAIGASIYHGTKRNDSVAWGLAWGFAASLPLGEFIVPAVAIRQGFGKRKKRGRRRR